MSERQTIATHGVVGTKLLNGCIFKWQHSVTSTCQGLVLSGPQHLRHKATEASLCQSARLSQTLPLSSPTHTHRPTCGPAQKPPLPKGVLLGVFPGGPCNSVQPPFPQSSQAVELGGFSCACWCPHKYFQALAQGRGILEGKTRQCSEAAE